MENFFNKTGVKITLGVLEVLFFTTLPTITICLFAILNEHMKFIDAIYYKSFEHGEFLLYSLALMSTAYTTSKFYNDKNNLSIYIIVLLIISVLYTLTMVLNSEASNTTSNINHCYLVILSVIFFLLSIYFTYKTIETQIKNNPDARGTNNSEVNKMKQTVKFG